MGDMADWILDDTAECENCGCLMKCRCKEPCELCGMVLDFDEEVQT